MTSSATNTDDYLNSLPDWQKANLVLFRDIIHDLYPNITEEIKWGVPTFIQDGVILFAMSSFKKHTKFNFIHNGALLSDDDNLFNNGLESKKSRGIDLREGETIDVDKLIMLVSKVKIVNP
jgi:hypothetical protein